MEYMHDLKDMLCDELEQIAEKGELTAGSLDAIQKLTHSLKSIDTIMAMEGYSGDRYDGYDMGGRSYARRDSRGRYSRRGGSYARNGRMRGGYSRDDEMDKMVAKLEKMMNEASDQNVKQAIEQAINAIEM